MNRSISLPDGFVEGKGFILLVVEVNKPEATFSWVGSTDGGVTFPYGPYTHTKYWAYAVINGPGFYRVDITYQGTLYHSNTVEITN